MSFWDIIWFFVAYVFFAYLMVLFSVIGDIFRNQETSGFHQGSLDPAADRPAVHHPDRLRDHPWLRHDRTFLTPVPGDSGSAGGLRQEPCGR